MVNKMRKSDKKKFFKTMYWTLGFIFFIMWAQVVWLW